VRRTFFKARFLGLVFLAMLAGVWPLAAQAAGGAADFAVLASGTGLTCTNATVDGPVGVTTGTPVTLTPPNCAFTVQNADGAYADFRKIYGGIANNLFPCQILSGTLAGQSLGTGVYCFPAAAALTGTLTLTGTGPWLFEIGTTGGALTTTNFTVVGSNPCNAFWWVQADVTTTDSTLQGTILGGGDITLTRTSIDGRAWATGAMTMTGPGNNIFGCNGAGTVARHHCNQGVGNGPEGCDPGNSNNTNTSNDELGGTPGDPGRQGRK
jgi:hypothetical protein